MTDMNDTCADAAKEGEDTGVEYVLFLKLRFRFRPWR